MKITAFDEHYTLKLAGGETSLGGPSSGGSNGGFGGDVAGTWGDLSVVGLRQRVSLSSNLAPSAAIGNVLTLISAGATPVAQFAAPSNSAGSTGSNSTRVSKNSSAGAGTDLALATHIHDGIGTITASSSNTLGRGTFNLRQGNNVSIGWTDTDGDGLLDTATIHSAPGAGGGGVTSISKAGSAALTGAVTLTGGTNVTLTQSGQDISIAASGGASAALVLLEQHTASSSATLDFTSWYSSTYDDYLIEILGIIPATNNVAFWLRTSTNGGSSYDTTNYYWGHTNISYAGGAGVNQGSNVGQIGLWQDSAGNGMPNSGSHSGLDMSLMLYRPGDGTYYKHMQGNGVGRYQPGGGSTYRVSMFGVWVGATTAINALRFLCSSGNITSGTVRIYGLTK